MLSFQKSALSFQIPLDLPAAVCEYCQHEDTPVCTGSFFLIGDSKFEASSILLRFGFLANRRLDDRGSKGFVSLFDYFSRICTGFALVLPGISVVFLLLPLN